MTFCLPTASVLTRYSTFLCVPSRRTLKKDLASYTAIELHSGNGPVSLWKFPGVNGELRRKEGIIVRISFLKSDMSVT